VNKEAVLHHAASACANCGADVSGNYCHDCGQETVLHPPSAREFMHEFIGHYVALEGKLWKSLGLLLFRPGRLTLEYIKGRRVPYVQPLRMYLTFSLIFFAVLKFSMHDVGTHVTEGSKHPAPAAGTGASGTDRHAPSVHAEPGKTAVLLKEDRPGEIVDGTRVVSDWLRPYSDFLASKVEHFSQLSFDQRKELLENSFYHYTPYAIFFMMPVFALYLKVLYLGSGRRYGEHLLFALHSNGFAFLVMSLMILVPGNSAFVEFVLWLWLTLYLPMAMRQVYGGSRTLTALRWIMLMLLHLLTVMLALFGAVAFGLLH